MKIRLIKEGEFKETAKMIESSLNSPRFSNYYPQCSIDYVSGLCSAENLEKNAKTSHFYIIIDDSNCIVACGAIKLIDSKNSECALMNIFVGENYQGKGYGTLIVSTLEKDIIFKNSKRAEISANFSAIPFYRKLGYKFKNNELIYNDGQVLLEKFN